MQNLQQRQKLIIKIISLLSIVRWYNVLIVALSMFLSALFLLNDITNYRAVLLDRYLYINVTAICLLMMAGFIINAFYDFEKDIINRPEETIFGRIISKSFCLNSYVFLILAGLLFSLLSGWEVLIFNFLFSFGLWFYSHKLRKKPFAGEINAALLTIAPFFSISLLYQEYNLMTIIFVGYIFVLSLTREIVKKMINIKGDLIVGEKSLPIVIGIRNAKYTILAFMVASLGCIIGLYSEIVLLPIIAYFIIAAILIVISIFLLRNCKTSKDYQKLNLIYKLLLIFAIFSIPLVGKWW